MRTYHVLDAVRVQDIILTESCIDERNQAKTVYTHRIAIINDSLDTVVDHVRKNRCRVIHPIACASEVGIDGEICLGPDILCADLRLECSIIKVTGEVWRIRVRVE